MASDDVRLIVGGRELSGWTGVKIEQSVDNGADAFSITAPFDHTDAAVREAFRPFGYQGCELYVGDDLILTGIVDRVAPTMTAREKSLTVSGRAKTGQLIDCSIEGKVEWNQVRFADIAIELARPFGVRIRWDNNTDPLDARARYGQGVYDFLLSLAAPHNLLLHSSPAGALAITWATWFRDNPPVVALVEGDGLVMGVSAAFDSTGRFSRHIVAAQFAGNVDTIGQSNDPAVSAYRPKITTTSEVDADPSFTAARKRTESIAASYQVLATVSTWRAPDGSLWGKSERGGRVVMPNVTLKAPSAMLYTETLYTVVGSTLRIDETDGKIAELRLMQPEYYAGRIPEVTPWE